MLDTVEPDRGHRPILFYALIPLFTVLAFLLPQLFAALTAGIGLAEVLTRLLGRR
jgi:hypothetical protein